MPERVAVTRARVAVALVLVALGGRTTFGQQLNVTRYATADGLPSASTLAVLQDSRGYLWFGTTGGLARYDGSTVDTFTTADGLTGNTIVALGEDRQGRLYAAAQAGGVSVLEAGTIRRLQTNSGAASRIASITTGLDGQLWLAGPGSLLSVSAAGDVRAEAASGLPEACCLAALRDGRGRLWVGTGRGLFREQGGTFRRERVLGTAAVNALAEAASGGMWAGSDAGVFREGGAGWLAVDTALSGGARVLVAARSHDGSMWFGSDRGAAQVGSGADRVVTNDNGLPDEAVRALTVDREGNVWFGTGGGAAKLVDTDFAIFTTAQGLPANFVVGVGRAPSGQVWVLHRRALTSIEGNRVRVVALGNLAGSATFTSVASLDDGRLLLGSSAGVFVWDPSGVAGSGPIPGSAGVRVTALHVAGAQLWVGTEQGLYRGSPSRIVPVETELALSRARVTAIDSQDGRTWIGTQAAGLFTHSGDGYSAVPLPTAKFESIGDLAVASDGRLWAATNGLGALRQAADGTLLRLTREGNGLASDFVQQVLPTSSGTVWIFTNRGLDSWDPNVGITHYDLAAGLADMTGSPGAAVEGSDGRLWFGTPSGLTVHRTGRSSMIDVPPEVVVRSVTVDGSSLPSTALLDLPSWVNEITFHFSALSYRDESSTRYQYRLKGRSNENWSRPSLERRVSFVGLPPGEYVFEVQAINGRGMWSPQAAAVGLSILPAPWQTAWFRWLLAALAAGLTAIWVRGRVRKIDSERGRLREIVEERTRELVEKNSLLERMATTDELTALPNRRFFLDGMERELRKMTRLPAEQPLSLLLIDLDRFKSINDRFGHVAGDEVLRQVSRRLAQTVRATDLPARYGGEEFAILLANTGPEGALFLAEKLRSDVEAMRIVVDGNSIPVTISLGVATVASVSRYDPRMHEDLLREADEALYRAKSKGRNRVEV